jgi:hypothetical protein
VNLNKPLIHLVTKKGFMRKSDPFFELGRQINSAGGATWDNVFRSDVVQDNLNPEWKTAIVPISTVCGGDLDLPIRVTVYDYESKGDHVLMGQFDTTINAMLAASTNGTDDMAKAFDMKKKNTKTGAVMVVKGELYGVPTEQPDKPVSERMAETSITDAPPSRPTFMNYVSGGLELNVVVAIDFTGSNGDPRKEGTLHYLGGGKNDYERAMSAILTVLAKFDHGKCCWMV